MFRQPEIEDIMECGKGLGLNLTSTEARIMKGRMASLLAGMEVFNELKIEEQHLPLRYKNRDPGYRPPGVEDPLNAFITKCYVEGADNGPLKGKRIGMKDNISLAGVPLTFGSHFMDGFIPDFDATIVTRVLDAGATIVGKMNMEDFSCGGPGLGGVGDFGRVLNPHNHEHMTGGSSSGSAVAVAAEYVDVSFGGDQGGSIRIPASWSGVIGLMPTHGLIPFTGVFGIEPTVDYVGPLARKVEDIALVLECVAGRDGYDPRQVDLPAQLPKYTEGLTHGINGLRIGVLNEGFGLEGSESDVDRIVSEAIDVLEHAGAHIKKVSVPMHNNARLAILPIFAEGAKCTFATNLGGAFTKTYYPSSLMRTFGRLKHSYGHELPPQLKLYLIVAAYCEHFYPGGLYAKAQNIRPFLIEQYNEALNRVDVFAMPTVPIKAPIYQEPKNFEDAIEHTLFGGELGLNIALATHNTCPFNLTGHPAISIPCGKSDGLPIGLMLVAPHFRENLLLRIAYTYQESVDWASLLPS